ncbi:hypothetical protein SAMN05216228_101517 [Rhizobium tibeticum]|uniref:Uncharacterized protein n=1 Tax=Rhizobium tibeticum TaxID=501024 RepID=A0A1H8NP06_9HYPH|nr:hypothetical protein RTCCBAU85039_3692 [Rhizobium tibeticum]SEO31289.1 hypothetical protein SAMN05216228_101517 [Rhizobium tibeticum]
MSKTLDIVTMGRAGVDLNGAQVGGRLEDMGSFEKNLWQPNQHCLQGVGSRRLGSFSTLRDGRNVRRSGRPSLSARDGILYDRLPRFRCTT